MRNRTPGHCSDETLIRYLDLELPSADQEAVRRHLGVCWRCRTRTAELEQTVHRVAALARADSFPGPGRAEAARARFLARAAGPARTAVLYAAWRRRGWAVAVAAAAAALLLAMAVGGRSRVAPANTPAAVTARVEQAERASLPRAAFVIQRFEVSLREVSPQPRRRDVQLELWSEGNGRQTGVRWLDAEGRLFRASLKTVTDAGGEPLAAMLASREWDWGALDAGVSLHLEGRRGPMLLVPEFRRFCAEAGLEPVLERGAGPSRVVLAAETRWRGADVRFWIEADGATWEPLRQGLRIRREGREFEIILEPRGRMTARSLNPALFRLASVPRTGDRKASPPPEPPPAPASVQTGQPGPYDLEVEVRYALHRAQGFARARLVVSPTAEGRVLVKGVAPTGERQEELEAALVAAGLRERTGWEVEVEARHASRPSAPAPGSPPALSGALHDEVWALVQLAERYDADLVRRLSGRSGRLLEIMIQDQLDGATARAAQLAERLGVPVEAGTSAARDGEDWRQIVFALYRVVSDAAVALEDGSKTSPSVAAIGGVPVLAARAGAALRDGTRMAREKGRP